MDKYRIFAAEKFLLRIRNKKHRDREFLRSPGYRLPADELCRKTGEKKEDYISVMS